MTKCEQVLEYNDKMIQARHKEMTKREQVLERISELVFERSEKNDASKTQRILLATIRSTTT
jgi:hypothetical protein